MTDGQTFILAIIGMAMFGGIIKASIRARAGLPDSRDRFMRTMGWGRWNNAWGQVDDRETLDAERRIALLTDENEKLHGKLGRLEERIAVLERIATDPAERTAREIDALRDR